MLQLIFFVSLALLCYLITCILKSREIIIELIESMVVSVIIAIIFKIAMATILSIIGIYSLFFLTMISVVALFVCALCCKKFKYLIHPKALFASLAKHRLNYIVLIALVVGIGLYTLFPIYYFWGGRDHGIYVINGVNVANTGSMHFESDTLQTKLFHQPYINLRLGYPGLYSAYHRQLSEDPGQLITQFLPVYFAGTAIAYDLFGLDGVFRLNGVITLLSALALYYLCKFLFSKFVATISFILLLINPAQLWNGRIPGTEILSQLLFFLAIYFFARAWLLDRKQKNAIFFVVASGAIICISMFLRIDTYIWGIGIFALWAYAALLNRNKLRNARILGIIYTMGVCLSLFFGFTFSRPYFYDLWDAGTLSGIIYLNIASATLVVLAEFIPFILGTYKKATSPNYLMKLLDLRISGHILSIFLLVLFLFAYFIRPIFNDTFDGNAMVEFTWYTSFIAVPLSIYGLFLALKGDKEKLEAQFLLLLIGVISVIGYIYRPSITPDHFWASRRWVTVNIPFLIIYSSCAMCSFFKSPRITFKSLVNTRHVFGVFGVLCTIVIALYSISQSSIFLFRPMFEDAVIGMESLAAKLDSNSVFLTNNGHLASPLRFIFGKNVYLVQGVPNYIPSFERQVYFISESANIQSTLSTSYHLVGNQRVAGQFPERIEGAYPSQLIDWGWDFYIFRVSPGYMRYITYDLNAVSGFMSQNNSVYDGSGFISNGNTGFLLFGPYERLRSGNFTAEFHLRHLGSNQATLGWVEVYSQYSGQSQIFARKYLTHDLFAYQEDAKLVLHFSLPTSQHRLEYRIFVTEDTIIQANQIIVKSLNE